MKYNTQKRGVKMNGDYAMYEPIEKENEQDDDG